MLMLILNSTIGSNIIELHFNTSHVNVNLVKHGTMAYTVTNFNTSHVNVNLFTEARKSTSSRFQYISC